MVPSYANQLSYPHQEPRLGGFNNIVEVHNGGVDESGLSWGLSPWLSGGQV